MPRSRPGPRGVCSLSPGAGGLPLLNPSHSPGRAISWQNIPCDSKGKALRRSCDAHVTRVSELKPDGVKIGVSSGSQKRGHRGQAAWRGPRRAPQNMFLQPAFGRAGQASHE